MQNIDVKVSYQELRNRYFIELAPEDARLIFEFFMVFSRFEFALKRSGYFRGDSNRAEPDWDKFCNTFSDGFDKTISPGFIQACEYYTTYPPRKQVVKDNQVVWKENIQGKEECEFSWIIRSIRTVRNNLFHGGKFPYDQVRNNALLFHGLVILHEVMIYDKNLESKFTFDPM
jgi:hypothetical protein